MLREFKSKTLEFTIIDSQYSDNIVEGYHSMSWSDFTVLMAEHIRLENKDDARQLIPVSWKPQEQWVKRDDLALTDAKQTFRNAMNISHINIAFLDLDEEGSLEQAQQKFAEFDYVIHSTFSGKHRMAIRLDAPIKADKWEVAFAHLMAGINGDTNCKNLSRGYLMPSVDKNSNNQPFSFVNEGKALTYDAIISLGERNMDTRTEAALEKIKLKAEGNGLTGVRRHFSGEVVNNAVYKKDELSYEGFKRRKQGFIEECLVQPIERGAKKGSRHDYALRVISSEVMRFKENTDFSRLIQFLYRSVKEFDKKPLSTGNTADEIPGMIENALINASIDNKTLKSTDFINDVREQIDRGRKLGANGERVNQWDFISFTIPDGSYSTNPYSTMKRYSSLIDSFNTKLHEATSNGAELDSVRKGLFNQEIAVPMIQLELKHNAKASIRTVGRLLLTAMKDLKVTRNLSEREDAYDSLTEAFANKLAKSNLKDSVLGRDMSAEEIIAEFNIAHTMQITSEAGLKAQKRLRQGKRHEREQSGHDGLSPS